MAWTVGRLRAACGSAVIRPPDLERGLPSATLQVPQLHSPKSPASVVELPLSKKGSGSNSLGVSCGLSGAPITEATSAKGLFEMRSADWLELKACSSMTLTFQLLRFAKCACRWGDPCWVCMQRVGCISRRWIWPEGWVLVSNFSYTKAIVANNN